MTRASSALNDRRPFPNRRFGRSGFSLIEVVIATGLCTYALVVIACLLPMGMGTVQTANAQIVETEIFNRIWLEVNSTPFSDLPTYYRFAGGTPMGSIPPTNGSAGSATGLSYFDKDGGELPSATGAIYIVYCTLVNSNVASTPATVAASTISRAATLGPVVDGRGLTGGSTGTSLQIASTGGTAGSGMTIVKVAIGFHVDPTAAGLSATDSRVTNRSFVIAKRDTYNGN